MSSSSSFDSAIIWHIYPLGFVGAYPAIDGAEHGAHSLRRIADWLDYARDLGVSVLQFGPIFASETHGYDTTDHFRIDPRLGDVEDFDFLVGEASARGIRIVLDGVFNHVGRSFPVFQEAEANPASAAAGWFRRSGDGWRDFEGHAALIALNHDSPAVVDFVAAVMSSWLDRGASGWRLDAAYAVPSSFWRTVMERVRATHPDAWFGAEVLHGDYAAFVRDSGVDSVTQYELWKAIWSSLNDANLFEVAWALKRHDAMLATFAPITFLGNHDVTRIASKLTDPRHLGHALALQLTVGGHPAIYAGDEQAMHGVKEDRAGGDDAVRPAFPDSPAGLPDDGWTTFRLHQRLIGLRRRHPWLVRGRSTVGTLTNTTMAVRTSAAAGSPDAGAFLVTLLNLGDAPVSFAEARGLRTLEASAGSSAQSVEPHGWAILGES
jgi:cyclomaltodextrinase